jgi:hypothetical protein
MPYAPTKMEATGIKYNNLLLLQQFQFSVIYFQCSHTALADVFSPIYILNSKNPPKKGKIVAIFD